MPFFSKKKTKDPPTSTAMPPKSLDPLLWLVGSWKAIKTEGFSVTHGDFEHGEIATFETAGHKSLLKYQSDTWYLEDNKPRHLERGFLQIKPGTNQVALMVTLAFGYSCLEEGTVEGKVLKTKSTSVAAMSFVHGSVAVTTAREYALLENGQLDYQQWMETVATPTMYRHVHVIYEKCK